jgi:hypothetical protein
MGVIVMSKLVFDASGERLYETGVKNVVLYPISAGTYPLGVAWNGVTGISEKPSGAEPKAFYADDIKYLNLMSVEEFKATLTAFMYPEEFMPCDGAAEVAEGVVFGQQNRTKFGLCYKTTLGNDEDGNSYGYKLHIAYGLQAAASEKAFNTINESPEAIAFSWELTAQSIEVTGYLATASIVIDSTKVAALDLAALELILYGTTGVDPRLPLPAEILSIFA